MLGWLFNSPIPPGTPAPLFSAKDHLGRPVEIASYLGNPIVLVFYPGDHSPT